MQYSHADADCGVKECTLHAEGGNEKDGEQRAESEAAVAADGKDADAGTLLQAGNAVDHFCRFGVKNRGADSHERDKGKQEPVVGDKAGEAETDAGCDDAEGHEPVFCAAVGPIAENRLHDGGKERGGKHEPRYLLVVHAVFRNKKWQQCRQ